MRPRLLAFAVLLLGTAAPAQRVPIGSGSVVKTVTTLKAGQFVWAPQVAPEGPMLLIVNLSTQRALLFRNGVPIGATTVSTGKTGHRTPTGVFTVLQKQIEHYSSKYDSAPMPYMQRLTWAGVALHAGKLPGYPASHGCIRLPAGFAQRLYGATRLGMTVVISDSPVT
ncbi:MAG TPA: L,D-transpeptidase family protein, partial [Sphingomicrobium sp.]